MDTIVKSSNGISLIPLETRLLSNRKLFINGEITSKSANEFEMAIMLLLEEDSKKPIDIYINSPGGSINDAGFVIYDILKKVQLQVEVNLHCRGMAGSMAAVLMAGGAKGHRFIMPHSGVMIHEPLIADGVGGSATAIMRTAENIKKSKDIIVTLLAKDTGKSKKEIEAAISFDNYMNAKEAIAFGICDDIEESIL